MMKDYAPKFDDSEANSLEHTALFNEYVKAIETLIQDKLKATFPWFSMTEFMQMLQ